MRKILALFTLVALCLLPMTALADEGPFSLPESANAEAKKHNDEGIQHWGEGHYDVALKHFMAASKIDASSGEIHFNEAIALDKLGKHGDAVTHFQAAKDHAGGNEKITSSPILNKHLSH